MTVWRALSFIGSDGEVGMLEDGGGVDGSSSGDAEEACEERPRYAARRESVTNAPVCFLLAVAVH